MDIAFVYIPKGYDNNDKVEIVFEGLLTDTCYKNNGHEVIINESLKEIVIYNYVLSYHNPYSYCRNYNTEYIEVVNLQVLEKGRYNILVDTGYSRIHKAYLDIEAADLNELQSPDKYNYAHVTKLIAQKYENDYELTLSGKHANSCLEISEVKVLSNGLDTLSILPIIETTQNCNHPLEFQHKIRLKNIRKRTLIHVRTQNGDSKNIILY